MGKISLSHLISRKNSYLPTKTNSIGEAFFLIKVLYTSMVKIVEAELKIEVSDDISAANITANINPRKTTKKK